MFTRLKTWLCFSIIQSFLWWLEEWCGGVYHETYKLEMIKLTKSSRATKCIRDALREKRDYVDKTPKQPRKWLLCV